MGSGDPREEEGSPLIFPRLREEEEPLETLNTLYSKHPDNCRLCSLVFAMTLYSHVRCAAATDRWEDPHCFACMALDVCMGIQQWRLECLFGRRFFNFFLILAGHQRG